MANPFVFAVMKAFKGKLPKPEEPPARKATDEKKPAAAAPDTPPTDRKD